MATMAKFCPKNENYFKIQRHKKNKNSFSKWGKIWPLWPLVIHWFKIKGTFGSHNYFILFMSYLCLNLGIFVVVVPCMFWIFNLIFF